MVLLNPLSYLANKNFINRLYSVPFADYLHVMKDNLTQLKHKCKIKSVKWESWEDNKNITELTLPGIVQDS